MRLILHAGTPKTGTTSIQGALAENRNSLRASGLWFPDASAWIPKDRKHHRGFTAALTGVDRDADQAARAFIAYLRDNAQPDETVLLSSESAYSQILGINDRSAYAQISDYWRRRQDYLSTLAVALHPFETEVVIYFRSPSEFAESLYYTLVIEFGWRRSFEEYLLAAAPLFDYQRQLAALRENFPRVTVVPYRPATSVTSFFKAIGFPAPAGSNTINLYRSPGPRVALWYAEEYPRVVADEQAIRRLRKFVRSAAASEIFDGNGTIWPSTDRRIAFDERHGAGFPLDFFSAAKSDRVSVELSAEVGDRISQAFLEWQQLRTEAWRKGRWARRWAKLAAMSPIRKNATA